MSTDQYRAAGVCFAEMKRSVNFGSAAAEMKPADECDDHDAAGNQEVVGHGAREARRIFQILSYPAGEQHSDDGEHAGDSEQHGAAPTAHIKRLHLIRSQLALFG